MVNLLLDGISIYLQIYIFKICFSSFMRFWIIAITWPRTKKNHFFLWIRVKNSYRLQIRRKFQKHIFQCFGPILQTGMRGIKVIVKTRSVGVTIGFLCIAQRKPVEMVFPKFARILEKVFSHLFWFSNFCIENKHLYSH